MTKPRVFVVDDEETIAFTLAAILTQSGFAATGFTNPLEALKAAEAQCPELLIADVTMPFLSGIDLCVQIKVIEPKCKIVLLSGHLGMTEQMETARNQGLEFEVLTKPVHPKELLEAIRMMAF